MTEFMLSRPSFAWQFPLYMVPPTANSLVFFDTVPMGLVAKVGGEDTPDGQVGTPCFALITPVIDEDVL
jgi:hypothetical protein